GRIVDFPDTQFVAPERSCARSGAMMDTQSGVTRPEPCEGYPLSTWQTRSGHGSTRCCFMRRLAIRGGGQYSILSAANVPPVVISASCGRSMKQSTPGPEPVTNVLKIDEAQLSKPHDQVVRDVVEKPLHELLDAEADRLGGAKRYKRSPA